MIKLYNRTPLSGNLLRTLLTDAQRLAGVKGDVIVKVGRTERGAHGMAHSCIAHKINGRWVKTSGGYFDIWCCLCSHRAYNVLTAAETFFWVAVHEFAHIRDYQADPFKSNLQWAKRERKRGHRITRMNHNSRPEEVRAENVVEVVAEKLSQNRRSHYIKEAIKLAEVVDHWLSLPRQPLISGWQMQAR